MDENKYVCEPHYDENGNFDYWNPLFPYRRGVCEVEFYDDGYDALCEFEYADPKFGLSCGHEAYGASRPEYCPVCGAKVVEL